MDWPLIFVETQQTIKQTNLLYDPAMHHMMLCYTGHILPSKNQCWKPITQLTGVIQDKYSGVVIDNSSHHDCKGGGQKFLHQFANPRHSFPYTVMALDISSPITLPPFYLGEFCPDSMITCCVVWYKTNTVVWSQTIITIMIFAGGGGDKSSSINLPTPNIRSPIQSWPWT